MIRRHLTVYLAAVAGLLVGLMLWGLALGVQIHRHEPGLWTLRFQRIMACGLDYNGPPYAARATLWLSCNEAGGWRLWPPADGR